MTWAIILATLVLCHILGGFITMAMMRDEAKPRVIKREDGGFGGEWK